MACWHQCRSSLSPPIGPPELIPNLSGCCSAANFTSLYILSAAVTDVAVNSTPMDIIVQRAGKVGC